MSLFRILLGVPLGMCLVFCSHAEETDHPNAVSVRMIRSDTIDAVLGGKPAKASLIEVTLPPGAESPPHHHPGPVTGYVLEGTLEFQIGDRPLRTLKAGDSFFEPTMILHRVARNPSDKRVCRVLVTMIHPADAKRLTIPAAEVSARHESSVPTNGSKSPR